MSNRKRNKTLTIRLTQSEKNLLLSKAKKAKMSTTDYIVSLSEKTKIILPPDLTPVIIEMKRLGNNLNQIAMKVNSGAVYAPEFKTVLEKQKEIYDLIYKLSEKS